MIKKINPIRYMVFNINAMIRANHPIGLYIILYGKSASLASIGEKQ